MPTPEIDKIVQFEDYSKDALKFAEFETLVEKYALSTFVSFVMFKNFQHTNIDELSNSEKSILMEECAPLLKEALAQDNPVQ